MGTIDDDFYTVLPLARCRRCRSQLTKASEPNNQRARWLGPACNRQTRNWFLYSLEKSLHRSCVPVTCASRGRRRGAGSGPRVRQCARFSPVRICPLCGTERRIHRDTGASGLSTCYSNGGPFRRQNHSIRLPSRPIRSDKFCRAFFIVSLLRK